MIALDLSWPALRRKILPHMSGTSIRPLSDRETARFWSHVEKTETCWVWGGATKACNNVRYGVWKLDKKLLSPHRVAFQLSTGVLDPALTIDHLCENKLCCNPAHLEQVTRAENTRRIHMDNKEAHKPYADAWPKLKFLEW